MKRKIIFLCMLLSLASGISTVNKPNQPTFDELNESFVNGGSSTSISSARDGKYDYPITYDDSGNKPSRPKKEYEKKQCINCGTMNLVSLNKNNNRCINPDCNKIVEYLQIPCLQTGCGALNTIKNDAELNEPCEVCRHGLYDLRKCAKCGQISKHYGGYKFNEDPDKCPKCSEKMTIPGKDICVNCGTANNIEAGIKWCRNEKCMNWLHMLVLKCDCGKITVIKDEFDYEKGCGCGKPFNKKNCVNCHEEAHIGYTEKVTIHEKCNCWLDKKVFECANCPRKGIMSSKEEYEQDCSGCGKKIYVLEKCANCPNYNKVFINYKSEKELFYETDGVTCPYCNKYFNRNEEYTFFEVKASYRKSLNGSGYSKPYPLVGCMVHFCSAYCGIGFKATKYGTDIDEDYMSTTNENGIATIKVKTKELISNPSVCGFYLRVFPGNKNITINHTNGSYLETDSYKFDKYYDFSGEIKYGLLNEFEVEVLENGTSRNEAFLIGQAAMRASKFASKMLGKNLSDVHITYPSDNKNVDFQNFIHLKKGDYSPSTVMMEYGRHVESEMKSLDPIEGDFEIDKPIQSYKMKKRIRGIEREIEVNPKDLAWAVGWSIAFATMAGDYAIKEDNYTELSVMKNECSSGFFKNLSLEAKNVVINGNQNTIPLTIAGALYDIYDGYIYNEFGEVEDIDDDDLISFKNIYWFEMLLEYENRDDEDKVINNVVEFQKYFIPRYPISADIFAKRGIILLDFCK